MNINGLIDNSDLDRDLGVLTDNMSAERMGKKIRAIREAQGISQAELGARVGLSADRIQKYENGARKPRIAVIVSIAKALGVQSLSIIDTSIATHNSALHALFELEAEYGIHMEKSGNTIRMHFDPTVETTNYIPGKSQYFNSHLAVWYKKYEETLSALEHATTQDEKEKIMLDYHMWEWNYPASAADDASKRQKKLYLKDKIEQLQDELRLLEDDEN